MNPERGSLLEGKSIIVAGGAGRLGREFCRSIVAQGGCAIVADRDLSETEAIAREISHDAIGKARGMRLDITSTDSVKSLLSDVHQDRGRIDAVVNSAYPRNANYGRKFEDVTYEDFSENMTMHVSGMFILSKLSAKYFISNEIKGNIVNISSVYGVVTPRFEIYDGTNMTMPVEYAAIKSAIIHLSKYMAKYFFSKGVRFNTISPGGILDNQPKAFIANYAKYCAGVGMLDKSDISGTLIFLLSDLSSSITGQNIIVDDGFSL